MEIEKQLSKFFKVIQDEIRTNPKFAQKIEHIFNDDKLIKNNSKRKAAALNPEILLLERGEVQLINELNALDLEDLRDIISEFGMDPSKRAIKWKTKDKVVDYIVEVSRNRSTKGNAFRS